MEQIRLVPVADALPAIHVDLGRPAIVPLDVAAGPAAMQRAVDHPGVLTAVLARRASEAHLVRTWLRGDDAWEVRVAEGHLVVLVHTPGSARSPEPARSAPLTTPDARPVPGATEADLDEIVLRQLLRAIDRSDERPSTEAGSTTERALGRAGLLAHDGRVWRPTVAALVLFGWRPDLFLPGCRLDARVDGERFTLRGTLVDRSPAGDPDPFVVHEALNNAVLHRDWSEDGARSPIVLTVAGTRVDLSDPDGSSWAPRGPGGGLARCSPTSRVGSCLSGASSAWAGWLHRWSLADRDGRSTSFATCPSQRRADQQPPAPPAAAGADTPDRAAAAGVTARTSGGEPRRGPHRQRPRRSRCRSRCSSPRVDDRADAVLALGGRGHTGCGHPTRRVAPAIWPGSGSRWRSAGIACLAAGRSPCAATRGGSRTSMRSGAIERAERRCGEIPRACPRPAAAESSR